jgi:hypothetical protein
LTVRFGLIQFCILSIGCLSGAGCSGEKPCDGFDGKCGLAGQCISCISDEYCPGNASVPRSYGIRSQCDLDTDCVEGLVCDIMEHICVTPTFCSLYGECLSYPQCGPDTSRECDAGEVCVDGKCKLSCDTDQDCLDGAGACHADGYCTFEVCSPGGTCPAGTVPVEGTLVCRSNR